MKNLSQIPVRSQYKLLKWVYCLNFSATKIIYSFLTPKFNPLDNIFPLENKTRMKVWIKKKLAE